MATTKYPWLDARGSLNWTDYINTGEVRRVVFQATGARGSNLTSPLGKPRQVRRHVIPKDPRTPAQIAQRNQLKQAMLAWQALTEPEKQTWRNKAKGQPLTGCMLFVSQYRQPPVGGGSTTWDAGATTWDGGSTVWDVPMATTWDAGATTWDAGATTWDTPAARQKFRAAQRRRRSLARSKTHQKRNR